MTSPDPSNAVWSTRWQEAWDAAQPTLSTIRASYILDDAPAPRPLRVNQLDSELLDQQLVHLLCEPLQKALGVVNAALGSSFELELSLLVKSILYRFSMWNFGATYGSKLQGLRYSVENNTKGSLSPSGLPRRILVIHGALTILLPYCYNRLRNHAISRAWPDAPSKDKRHIIWKTLTRLEATYSILGLMNFIGFLYNGRYRSLTDRFLKMALVPSKSKATREVSYEFMNRQMVWHAFTEFLLFLLPLVNTRSLQRSFVRGLSKLASALTPPPNDHKSRQRKHGKYESLPVDQCAICAENASYTLDLGHSADALTSLAPYSSTKEKSSQLASDDEIPTFAIHTPYVTSCGHIYCYYCITERMMRTAEEGAETGWECLRCAEHVRSADRWEASAARDSGSDSDYEFSSEFGTTDLSGSVSSYMGSLTE